MQAEPQPGLVAAHVSAFRAERLVLHDLSFHVPQGTAALLLGPNGAGKSTLLRVLAGLKRPDAGHVAWNGQDPRDHPPAFLGHLDAIKPGLSVAGNLRFPHPPANPDALGLLHLADVPARLLSAGQKRRLALTRLVNHPAPLWLLDEPTLGLDTSSVATLGHLMAAHLSRGGTIVAATHLPLPLPNPQTIQL